MDASTLPNLLERLWPCPQHITVQGTFSAPAAVRVAGGGALACRLADDLEAVAGLTIAEDPAAYPIHLAVQEGEGQSGAYHLAMHPEGTSITGADQAGLAYGAQTLLQLLALPDCRSCWPDLLIHDWPVYRKRGLMLDLGRSVFSLPYIKRIIRILARLKMNQLHLHLLDDELCGLRFAGQPFGQENPYALSLADLTEIVNYAASYHIEVVPELEGWGHVGSLVYHRPDLRGGDGEYGGSSLLIGEPAFDLMRTLVRQVAETLPQRATIHLGLDEALLFLAPDMPRTFTPKDLVERYHRLIQEVGQALGKELTLMVWGDLVGPDIPPALRSRVIVQPWRYWDSDRAWIQQAIADYSAQADLRWMMGGGQSVMHYRGTCNATRHWCLGAVDSPNVEGINITFWGSNDLDQKFYSLFTGAYYAWNPRAGTSFANISDRETFDRCVYPMMYSWQTAFRDANPDELRRERGEHVLLGHYLWGDRHGQPVCPTVVQARTFEHFLTWIKR